MIGIVITGVDITKSEQLKQELSIKNQAIDEAQTPIIISDATEQGFPITYVNKAFERQTGYAANEVIGRNCGFLQGQNTQPHKKALIKSALRNFEPITVNIINYKKSGEEFHNQLSLTPIRNHDNLVTHVLGFQQDVTHQEKTQQYLEDAKFKAEESAQLKSEFLASMSHEIRTPMNGILGMLGLLESSSLTKEQIQHVKLAKSSADALLVLINDILDFSKIEAGKLTLENVA
ncbi:histidine kinase dimerization/phospho-acceptor domain-containing protein, partial [Oleiphilus sp. HI0066]|uniref:histidine kinase dimerization/phospho-acceptor domain-containing protein n=1 Tax=Oleiphilus sp. HI0066 TaxID=1822242 RepID=UPI001E5BB3B5